MSAPQNRTSANERKLPLQDRDAERAARFASEGKQRSSPHIIPSIVASPPVPRNSSKSAIQPPNSPKSLSTTTLRPGSLEEFVPRRVLQWYIKNVTSAIREPKIVPISGVVAFFDVSGFTPMTETLSQRGPEGAEMVCTILSEYFTTVLDVIFSWGGDVIKFAGDALLVCFRTNDDPKPTDDIATALCAIQCALTAASLQFERQGVPLFMKVALGVGAAYMVHVGSEDRWEIFVAGPPLHQIGSAEHEATIGATLVSPELFELIGPYVEGTKTAGGNFTIKALKTVPPQPSRPERVRLPEGIQAAIGPYVPEPARVRIQQGIPLNLLADIRIVSVVFISLTNIATKDASMLEPLCSACAICVSAFKRYRGTMRQFLQEDKGVTCIGVFGLPGQSAGDDAVRATKAAMRIQQQLSAAGLDSAIGVTTGKAYCGIIGSEERHEYAVVGPVVNLSARLMAAASRYLGKGATSILADSQTHKLAATFFKWETPDPIMVKGKSEPVAIFRLISRASYEKIFLTKAARMVGRDEEYAQVKEALKAVQDSGQGNVVVVEGAQGLGKSLLWERIARDLQLPVGKGETKKMESTTPFAAISRLLSRLFQSNKRPEAPSVCTTSYCETLLQGILEQTRSELIPFLSLLNSAFHLTFPLSREAVAIEGPLKRQKLFELLSTFIEYVTNRPGKDARPFLIVLEDAHEMDDSSWAFLRHHVGTQPMKNELWMVLHRPMNNPSQSYTEMLESPRVRKLVLKPLDDKQVCEVLCAELCVRHLPPQVTSRVLPRAQGNPFFAAVLMQSLVDSQACKVCNGVVQVDEAAIATVSLSDQIERAILSRIDRLGEVQGLLLRVCSCIGTEFAFALLVDVFPLNVDQDSLVKELSVMEELGFVFCERISMTGKPLTYVFPQTIVQEVAYNTFAFGPRQDIHRKIAAWYHEQMTKEGPDGDPALFPVIAQHYQRAGELLMAAEYLRRTGDINMYAFNNSEAISAYKTALSLEKQKPGLLTKVHLVYFHRVIFDLSWLSGALDMSDPYAVTRFYLPVFALIGMKLPTDTEVVAGIRALRREWLHNHLDHINRLGTASPDDRPIFVELAKCALRLYRGWILRVRDSLVKYWCQFWMFHALDWAERSNSPDLGYLYTFAQTLRRIVPTSDVLMLRYYPKWWARWALTEAAQHSQPELMILQTRLFNSMFSAPDWTLLTTGYEDALKLWKQMTPTQLLDFRSADSQVSYEDTLTTYGAGLIVIGNFRRAYEIGQELSQTLRGKTLKVFQEVAQRHMAISLILMRRYDDAEKIQIEMEQIGTKTLSVRAHFSWGVRYALLHLYRGELELTMKHVRAIMPMVATMTTVWFLGIYFYSLGIVVLKAWRYYCNEQAKRILDISEPLSEEDKRGPHGSVLVEPQVWIEQARIKLWEVGYVWTALLPQVWIVQGEYFMMALRRDKAIHCYRLALRLAEKEKFIYAEAKCRWVLGQHVADAAEAMLHLQQSIVLFEQSGAAWEKAAVQEDLRKAEQALMSTIMF